MLQIPLAELQEHGVVSAHTAERMAAQARLLTGADYGVSLTGVAGPDSLEAVSYTHLEEAPVFVEQVFS